MGKWLERWTCNSEVPSSSPAMGRVVQRWVKITQGHSAKFELRYESVKKKFSLILFAYNLMIGYSKKI